MLREFVRVYVRERMAGKRSSKVKDKSDLLSLFLSQPDIFSEEFIIDETMDLFLGGSITAQFVTQAMICHFATAP